MTFYISSMHFPFIHIINMIAQCFAYNSLELKM